ncbi:MAG: acyl-CoA reductase [Rhodothermales bacterium]
MKKDLHTTNELLAEALARAAESWQDPDFPPRAQAVKQTLEAPNRFTEEAVTFAVNQQMNLLTPERLGTWIGCRFAERPRTVGVLNAGNIPLVGLQDFLAVVCTGHRYLGSISSKSPYLLPAFVTEVRRNEPELCASFATADEIFDAAEAVIATGSDETKTWVEAQCEQHSIPSERCLLRGHRYGVAVVDGKETEDEWERLAEDALLHEGLGCRNVALIWAPEGLPPDAFLQSMAAFRAVFPPHKDTAGALRMQQAFLEALDLPHAYGDGLEFLLSKGEADVQGPGHVRWVEYTDLNEVAAWLVEHAREHQLVVARTEVARRLPPTLSTELPGEAQRPALDWCPEGTDTVAFLSSL